PAEAHVERHVLRFLDGESFHARSEFRDRHPQLRRRTRNSGYSPPGGFHRRHEVIPLGPLEFLGGEKAARRRSLLWHRRARGLRNRGVRQRLPKAERAITRQDDRTLNDVLQLPNVPRPVVRLETPFLRLSEPGKRTIACCRMTAEEMLDERRNVLQP